MIVIVNKTESKYKSPEFGKHDEQIPHQIESNLNHHAAVRPAHEFLKELYFAYRSAFGVISKRNAEPYLTFGSSSKLLTLLQITVHVINP